MKRTPEEKLLHPRPGNKIAEARDFGIDLTLLISKLRKTPQERIDDPQSSMEFMAEIAGARKAGPISNSK